MTDDFAADEEILKGAEERAGKAQPGPWHWEQQPNHGVEVYLYSARTDCTHMAVLTGAGFPTCDFIAAARTDIPALAAIARKTSGR